MRLICPSCDAEYKVPDNSIPEHGRDVQCSNCGHIWLETLEAHQHKTQIPTRESRTAELARERSFEQARAIAEQIAPTQVSVGEADAVHEFEGASAADIALHNPFQAENRSPIDPRVVQILQEEAQYSKTAPLVDVPDAEAPMAVGVEPRADEVSSEFASEAHAQQLSDGGNSLRPVRPKPVKQGRPQDNTQTAAPNSREQDINKAVMGAALLEAQQQKISFRRGFVAAVTCLALLCGTYIFGGDIAKHIPSIAPTLERYSGYVDHMRLWLNDKVNIPVAQTATAKRDVEVQEG